VREFKRGDHFIRNCTRTCAFWAFHDSGSCAKAPKRFIALEVCRDPGSEHANISWGRGGFDYCPSGQLEQYFPARIEGNELILEEQ